MKNTFWLLGMVLVCASLTGGGTLAPASNDSCTIKASVIPPNAVADQTAAPPGNQVQFSAVVEKVSGTCPQIATAGSWKTSDPANTSISNEPPTQGLATCRNTTPTPATISYTGTIDGQPYTPATLTCDANLQQASLRVGLGH